MPRDRKTKEPGSCPLCWGNKHACQSQRKSPNDRCKSCNHKIMRGINDTQDVIHRSQTFPEEAVYQQFRNKGWLTSLDTFDSDTNILDLRIKSSTLPVVELSVNIAGPFAPQNRELITLFDTKILEKFSAKLNAREGPSPLIKYAALAGGYLHVLCSAGDIEKQVGTHIGLSTVAKEYSEYNMSLHLRYFLLCRFRNLVDEVMTGIRPGGSARDDIREQTVAYAAAAILHIEVDHFKCSLRNGALSARIPDGLEGPFLAWLTTLEVELRDRLMAGCGRFSAWQSVIDGSMKKLRRHGETLTIVMHLQQPNAEDWSLLHRQTSGSRGSPGRSTCGSESSISSDTGQVSQSTTSDYVNSMSMNGGQPPPTSMTVSPLGTPSVIGFNYAPQFGEQYSGQANDYLAPEHLMTTGYPDFGFDFTGYPSNGETGFQWQYWDPQLLSDLSLDQNFGELPFQEFPDLSHNWPLNYTI